MLVIFWELCLKSLILFPKHSDSSHCTKASRWTAVISGNCHEHSLWSTSVCKLIYWDYFSKHIGIISAHFQICRMFFPYMLHYGLFIQRVQNRSVHWAPGRCIVSLDQPQSVNHWVRWFFLVFYNYLGFFIPI